MAVSRERKDEIVIALVADLRAAQAVILTDYRGLPVTELAGLRNQLRGLHADYHVAKNTLVARALQAAGMPAPAALRVGPTAVAFLKQDLAGPAKVINAFFREKGIPVKGAIVGTEVYDARGVSELAELPSREQLYANVLGALQGPAASLVGVLQAALSELVYTLQAKAEQAAPAA